MILRAVLFDLDGTLVDSLADIAGSMNTALQGLGLPVHDLESYRRFVGDGVSMLARRALPPDKADEAGVSECVAEFRRVYSANSIRSTRPYAGIAELLDELTARGLALAVLSNKPHPETVSLVAALLPRWRFDPVFGERPGVPRKPDPAGALETAARLGLEAREILYVGDTPTDVATALAAGMPVVGACWGFRDARELREAGARDLAARPPDVLDSLR